MATRLTIGRLDGLLIRPIFNCNGITHLDLTVEALPGIRVLLEADAAREIVQAFTAVLAIRKEPP